MPVTTDVTKPAGREPARRRRTVILAVVLAVVVVSGVMVGRWWTHPTAFNDLGDGYEAGPRRVADAAVSTTVIFPKIAGSREAITLHDLSATFSENTAGAEATFWLCHMAPGEVPIGAVHDPGATCSDIERFEAPMQFDHGVDADSDYVFVTVSPTRAGVAHLKAVDVDYRRSSAHLFQRGTQTILADRKVTAR